MSHNADYVVKHIHNTPIVICIIPYIFIFCKTLWKICIYKSFYLQIIHNQRALKQRPILFVFLIGLFVAYFFIM